MTKHIKFNLLAVAMLATGCGEECSRKATPDELLHAPVRVRDGCEYFEFITYMSYKTYCHKGNCTNHPTGAVPITNWGDYKIDAVVHGVTNYTNVWTTPGTWEMP